MSRDPTGLPSFTMRLPAACPGKRTLATAVTTRGYAIPVTTVMTMSRVTAGRSTYFMASFSDQVHDLEQHIDDLDTDERHQDAAEAVDEQIAAQQYRGAERPVAHALQGER